MAEEKKQEAIEEVKVVKKTPPPKVKPKLDPVVAEAMKQRKAKKDREPEFLRQEWFRYQRLGMKWRLPRGNRSKLRRAREYRINRVSIGYGGPKLARGLHPSGFREVLVHNVGELARIDPAKEAARIAGSVGKRKRKEIVAAADAKGVKVLNRGGL